jgi:UPF0716 protein FxsA
MTRTLRLAVPAYLLLEALVTLQIAASLGAVRTLLLLLLGVAAGIAVLWREQLSVLSRLRRAAASREAMLPALLDGAVRAVAGALLIIPGFVSDAAALALLLVPGLRRRFVRWLAAALGHSSTDPLVIEGDYRPVDDPALPATPRKPW